MKRNKFSLSYFRNLTCDMGQLVPIGITEVLPGDSIQHATSLLIRTQPLLAPVMHPVVAKVHHWFVPFRLLWENWENFITGGEDGMDASVFPFVNVEGDGAATSAPGTLADYLGVPPTTNDLPISALPFRAYNLIYNEWYRDQDLQTARVIDITDGEDTTTDLTLAAPCWEKDYFTTSRPWTQKGPEVSIPFTGTADVIGDLTIAGMNTQARTAAAGGGTVQVVNAPTPGAAITLDAGSTASSPMNLWNPAQTLENSAGELGLEADLTDVDGISVNDLRRSLAIQRWEEARAMYGSRYSEYLRYLGIKSSDARLQRPEYLGGGKQTIQFSEVLQTGVTTDGDDEAGVGNMKGHGIGAMRSNRYRRFFEEHGYIVTLMYVQPKTMYQDGLPKHFNRRTKFDFWQKELEHIGQEEILVKEVYADADAGTGTGQRDGVWSYNDRYDSYRRSESGVAGAFRAAHATPLDFWNMARSFSEVPVLNSDFVTSNPTDRIYVAGAADQLLIQCSHNIQARRLVSANSKPKTF